MVFILKIRFHSFAIPKTGTSSLLCTPMEISYKHLPLLGSELPNMWWTGGTTCPSTQPCSFFVKPSDSLLLYGGPPMHWRTRYHLLLITSSGHFIKHLFYKITYVQSSAQKATTGYLSFPSAVEQSQIVWESRVSNWTTHLICHLQKNDIIKILPF